MFYKSTLNKRSSYICKKIKIIETLYRRKIKDWVHELSTGKAMLGIEMRFLSRSASNLVPTVSEIF